MSISKTPQEIQKELDIKMKEFLEKGGKVQKLEPGVAYNLGSFDSHGKPSWSKDEIKRGVKSAAPMPDYDTYKKGSYHDYDVGGDKPPRWKKQPKNEMGGK